MTSTTTKQDQVGLDGPNLEDSPTADGIRSDAEETSHKSKVEKGGGAPKDEVTRQAREVSYVGWKQIGGWQEKDTLTVEDELIDLNKETFLDNILPDAAYGDWYHSLGILFLASFLSFFIGWLGFSLASVFFVMVAASLYYRTSVKKYRSSLRDEFQKELAIQKIEDDRESMDWMNNFLDKYWLRLEPGISQMIVQSINPVLASNPSIPAFITALWIDQLTLGVKPPRIEHVKTYQNTDSDVVVMDWDLLLTPHNLSDMNAKQMRNYVNQRLVIKLVAFNVTLPIHLSDVSVRLKLRVRFKLMTPYPHLDTINIQLIEVPDIDFVARLFGNFIFNGELLNIPLLLPAVKKLVQIYAGPMLLPPFSFQLNIPQLLSGTSGAIGVLKLVIKNATDIKKGDSFTNQDFNPYVSFDVSGVSVGRTKACKDTLNPVWDETKYILLSSFAEPLAITLVNEREKLKDKTVGRAEYNLNPLQSENYRKDLCCDFLRNSKSAGKFNFDLRYFPVVGPKRMPDGTVEEPPDYNTGIARILIEEIGGLGEADEDLTLYVELYYNSKLIFTTPQGSGKGVVKWNQEHENVVTDRRKSRYKMVIKNNEGETLASVVQSLNDMIDRTEVGKKEFPMADSKAQMRVDARWKPVGLDIGTSAVSYIPPIGVIRVFLNKAEGLRNLEKMGKIDPYARVFLNDNLKERTDERPNTLNPVWNQAIYVAVTSPHQKLTIEVMDVETVGADRSVGKFDVKVDDMFHKDEEDRYLEHVDNSPKIGRLVTKKGLKGSVTYYLGFYPCLPILTLDEMEEIDAALKRGEALKKREESVKNITRKEHDALEKELTDIADIKNMYSKKMKLGLDELLQYNAGVFSVVVLDGELSQLGLYVQTFFDSSGHARFVSPKIPTRSVQTPWTGDVMIKELEYSVATFRAVKSKNNNRSQSCVCEVSIPTIELVKNCYYKPSILTLSGEGTAKLMLQVSWFPVAVTRLPQSDLITNSGDLTVTAKSAENLISADKNGLSDPFLKFYINDSKEPIFKTKRINKTLDPVWNESETFEIYNRVNDYLRITVMDWDAGNPDDTIGKVVLPLSKIDPENPTDLDLPVVGENGEDGGILHLSFTFAPRYTNAAHKNALKVGDLATKGIGGGFKAGANVVHGGFGTIGKLGKTMFGGKKNHYVAQGIFNSVL